MCVEPRNRMKNSHSSDLECINIKGALRFLLLAQQQVAFLKIQRGGATLLPPRRRSSNSNAPQRACNQVDLCLFAATHSPEVVLVAGVKMLSFSLTASRVFNPGCLFLRGPRKIFTRAASLHQGGRANLFSPLERIPALISISGC